MRNEYTLDHTAEDYCGPVSAAARPHSRVGAAGRLPGRVAGQGTKGQFRGQGRVVVRCCRGAGHGGHRRHLTGGKGRYNSGRPAHPRPAEAACGHSPYRRDHRSGADRGHGVGVAVTVTSDRGAAPIGAEATVGAGLVRDAMPAAWGNAEADTWNGLTTTYCLRRGATVMIGSRHVRMGRRFRRRARDRGICDGCRRA